MKIASIFVLLLFSLSALAEGINLKDAIKSKQVECTITGNSNSTHYVKPLTIKIKNLKNAFTLNIDNGQIFIADDSSYQNVVVTNGFLASFKAGEQKEFHVYAMCIEHSDRAPGDIAKYKMGSMSDVKLKKMTMFIEEKKYFNQTAQQAVWAVVGNTQVSEISGYAEDGWEDIVKFTATLLGQPIPPKPSDNDYKRNYNVAPTKRVMKGNFEFDFPSASNVTIGMFNKDGIIVRELYNNPAHPKGTQKLHFEFDAGEYNDKIYYIKVIVDGEVFIEKKIETLNPRLEEDN